MNAAVSLIGGTNGNKKGLSATLAANRGELKLRASLSDNNFTDGSTLNLDDLLLSVEKPGSFIIDFDIPKKDIQFQFMNTFKVEGKQVNWTYTHVRNENRTVLDGSLLLDRANKFSASHELGSVNCKLKYSYVHRGLTTFEPCYDLAKKSWDLAVSRRVLGGDLIKATYQTSSQVLGVEWSSSSLINEDGRIKAYVTEEVDDVQCLQNRSRVANFSSKGKKHAYHNGFSIFQSSRGLADAKTKCPEYVELSGIVYRW